MSNIREYGSRMARQQIIKSIESGVFINFVVKGRRMRIIDDNANDLTKCLAMVFHIPCHPTQGLRIGTDYEDSAKVFAGMLADVLPNGIDFQWRIVA